MKDLFEDMAKYCHPDFRRGMMENQDLIGYETATFFYHDCEIEFTAQFDDEAETYNDHSIVVGGVDITQLFTEDQWDNFYRRAMSVRGK